MKKDLKLSDIPKHNVFQVPDDYFDRLPMRVMARTAAVEREEVTWQTSFWQRLRLALPALALLLLFAGIYVLHVPAQPEEQATNLTTVSDAQIVEYLSTYATVESSDFAELSSLQGQELTAEFMNISPASAAEELEYYRLDEIDY
ncbi:hypothetical protein CLV24_12080 [Pontibacter ummariensis]|uniref:Uncharacterized protein n=1 Tax=Pontibacter ummariensis TaxID=1610492 RepID=A0A239J8M3_9BACT|nr:hypothetical protein [Pontibacter ummariensis]PRY08912.1 hypothetical protein CLV24_12080 [Pontibacter ummariensis]SNT01623.1 hypothetical protein SAMN06296052_12079 [Pontibacter ummariensis]